MFCFRCGSQLPDGSKFCPNCGAQVIVPRAASASSRQVNGMWGPDAPYGHDFNAVPAPAVVPKRRLAGKAPIIMGTIFVMVVAAAAVAFVMCGMFSGGSSADDVANSSAHAWGFGASIDGYDYFYSGKTEAIMRAKGTGAAQSVYPVNSSGKDYDFASVFCMASDGSRLYFVFFDSYDPSPVIHSIRADGTDDKVICTLEGDGSAVITGLQVHKGRLYFALSREDNSGFGYDIVSVKTDGSDYRLESAIRNANQLDLTLTADRVFYSAYDFDKGQSAVYSQRLDGSDFKQLYSSSTQINTIAVSGDCLVFPELDRSSNSCKITSVKKDGSDAKMIYADTSGEGFSMLNVADGKVYIGQPDSHDALKWDLMSVPAAGGDPKILQAGVDYSNPVLAAGNDHLLLFGNDLDAFASSGTGVRVQALKYDGTPIATYVS